MIKVLFAASESVPFIKTGGLADVVGALPPVFQKKGMDIRVIMPKYSEIAEEFKRRMQPLVQFQVDLGWRIQYCGIETLTYAGLTWYFVDNKYYFDRPYVYGLGGDEYERYGFFCRAVLNALPLIDFAPDILHCHDWQTGMIPALHKIQYAHIPFYANMKTIQTVHNLQYQGIFGIKDVQDFLGLGDDLFTNDKLEAYGMANFLKAGLVYADEITTVSKSYAEEITTAFYGERLDGLLRARHQSLHGILNGIDVTEYDPATDPCIHSNYTAEQMEGKAASKAALQRELGLMEAPDVPLLGMVTRLSNQKGLDLLDYVISDIMAENVQLVVLGKGDNKYIDLFTWAESAYPSRVVARFEMNHALAHRIYAGADMFLMPSQFEPCGLSQMISLRYGTMPIVRETGGLRDTVLSYNEYTGEGNGFTFFNYNAHDFLHTVRRALSYYRNEPEIWNMLIQRGMAGDYSWDHSANEYIMLYQRLLTTSDEQVPITHEHNAHGEVAQPEVEPDKPTFKATSAKKPKSKKPAQKKEEQAEAPLTVTPSSVTEKEPAQQKKKKAKPSATDSTEKPAPKPRASEKVSAKATSDGKP